MTTKLAFTPIALLASAVFCACGGAATSTHNTATAPRHSAPAVQPAPDAVAANVPTDSPPAADVATADTSEAETPSSERDGIRKASRPPAELIMASNVLYVFNFSSSAVGEAARELCESESGGDPKALNECLAEARAKIPVEFIQFTKDKAGNLWWITYNKYKGNLLKWHRVQFQPGEETSDTLVLKLIGKDKGIAPMARVPKSLAIELPNDYSIVVKDPEHGPMTFDAKIGLMEPDQS